MTQLGLDLLPRRRARRDDPHTSKEAAASAGSTADDHCARILAVLDRGLTIYELAALTGLTHVQVARRLPDLERDGKARRREVGSNADGSPKYDTRPSPSGRACALWERTP